MHNWQQLTDLPPFCTEGYTLLIPFNPHYPRQFTFYLLRYSEDGYRLTLGQGNHERAIAEFDKDTPTDIAMVKANDYLNKLGQALCN